MSRKTVCIDDNTGRVSADANPSGWLAVTVTPIVGGAPLELTFESWTSFRHWVELSDPSCGQVLNPPVKP